MRTAIKAREFKVCRDKDGWYKLFPKKVTPEKLGNIWICKPHERQHIFAGPAFKGLFLDVHLARGQGPVLVRVIMEEITNDTDTA